MSAITALVKLPCIVAVTASIHTTLTVPAHPSKVELVSIPRLRGVITAYGLRTLTPMKVRKAYQTTYSYLIDKKPCLADIGTSGRILGSRRC